MWPEARKQKELVNPDKVELPPYYPDHPVVRDEMANYLDAVNYWDTQVGGVLEALRADGLLENTAIFVFGDNGRCLIRGKQWLYDPGTHVPLLVRWPGHVKAGLVRRDPVISLDITATALEIAGVPRPKLMHGQSLLGSSKPRSHVFTARDRCDMTVDRIRAVRDSRHKLIRNFMPDRPYTQFNEYITNSYPTQRVIKELHAAGKLNTVQAKWMSDRKPDVELYEHQADPYEVTNLAGDSKHKQTLARLTGLLDRWIVETNDHGRTPESRETIEREEPRAKAAIL
jgi:arylsulfatase A-like enzyme